MYGIRSLRFSGLNYDPNYYSIAVIIAVFLCLRLLFNKEGSKLFLGSLIVSMITFGFISYSKMFLLAIYDPSIDNHFYAAPNKFYESLMLGKPVMMVKNTGMSTVVKDENIGVLIDYSKEGFIRGAEELVAKKDEWISMSQRMKKLYKEQYSWAEMERRLVELYTSI